MEKVHPSVSQDILAARWYDALADQFLHEQVSQLGFIEYGDGGLKVHTSLVNVIVHD